MRKRHTDTESPAAVVNLTPLLDMVFILLIFFLVTSSFLKESGVEINRPTAKTAEPQPAANIVIAIDANGMVWIDRHRIAQAALAAEIERLHAANPDIGVIVTADRDSRTGILVKTLDTVRLAGITDVAVATSQYNGER